MSARLRHGADMAAEPAAPDPSGPRPLVLTARGWAALGRRTPAEPVPNEAAGVRYALTAAGRAVLGTPGA